MSTLNDLSSEALTTTFRTAIMLLCPRIQFYEINDQTWFPQYLREKVQSCLTLAWTFKEPTSIMQKTSPAQLVASTLYRVLTRSVQQYTYVDFCAGAGGPTPFIEQHLNAQLQLQTTLNGMADENGDSPEAVRFVLTDLHPHIKDWTEAAKKSKNLSFIARSVDAANAPADLIDRDGKKVFRLFNLAFHHFDDHLGRAILRNTLETADGFGIFELQERTISSFITITGLGLLMLVITPFCFWRSPGHLFFTYVIPIIPFVLVFDGYISSLRTRSSQEIQQLMKECGASAAGWSVKSGAEVHSWPVGYMSYVIGVKE